MPPYSRTSAFMPALTIAAVAMSGAISADTSGQQIIDARRETQVWRAYAQSQYLRANTLEVSVLNGKATLTGRVEGQLNKYLAKLIALGVEGVAEVDNQIVVFAAPPVSTSAHRAQPAPSGNWSGEADNPAQRTPAAGRGQRANETHNVNREGFTF